MQPLPNEVLIQHLHPYGVLPQSPVLWAGLFTELNRLTTSPSDQREEKFGLEVLKALDEWVESMREERQ